MNKLPTYVLAEDERLNGGMVLQTEYPYIIGKPYKVDTDDLDKLKELADTMREGIHPMVKVDGYTVFFTRWSTLTGAKVDYATTRAILKEMAEYYLKNKILKHKYVFRNYDEERIK